MKRDLEKIIAPLVAEHRPNQVTEGSSTSGFRTRVNYWDVMALHDIHLTNILVAALDESRST
jgi:hypothetical protein